MPRIEDPLVRAVIGCAIDVHRSLGPGLVESCYKAALGAALRKRAIPFETEVPVRATYDGMLLGKAYRLDVVIARRLLLEAKSVVKLQPIHSAQVLTYLRLSGLEQALLINFNVSVLRHGLKSFLWSPPDGTKPFL